MNSRRITSKISSHIAGANSGDRQIQVVQRRRGQRIQRTAYGAHGRGENGRDDQTRESCGHHFDDEAREDGIGAGKGLSLVELVEPDTDQEEHRELREHDESTADEGAPRFPEIPRCQQSLHDQLIGAV